MTLPTDISLRFRNESPRFGPADPFSWEKVCCPSTEMRSFLRDYLADEFLLTLKSRDVLSGYWHVTPARLAALASKKKRGDEHYQETVRLTWPAQSLWEDNYQFLPVSFSLCHQCMQIPVPGLTYEAAIGWMDDDGYFIPVLTSNPSDYPKNFSRPFPKDGKPRARK